MVFHRPVVWRTATIPSFIQHISNTSAATSTVMICCSKKAFLDTLQESLNSEPDNPNTTPHSDSCTNAQSIQAEGPEKGSTVLSRPTLQLLAVAHNVRLVFCPDITHLRAYLANYPDIWASRSDPETRDSHQISVLAILNLFELHRPTSAFSAQGLNRTLASAVEAAFQTRSMLMIAECPSNDAPDDASELSQPGVRSREDTGLTNYWNEEISLLNVTTKSFGVGDRGWVGRTTSLRSVAERWCAFVEQPPMTFA